PAHVEYIRGFHLHSIRQFERLDAGVQLRISRATILVTRIERLEQVELAALFFARRRLVADILDELVNFGVLRVDVSALVNAREKTCLPILRFLDWISIRAHGDEAGQILILGTQAISDP